MSVLLVAWEKHFSRCVGLWHLSRCLSVCLFACLFFVTIFGHNFQAIVKFSVTFCFTKCHSMNDISFVTSATEGGRVVHFHHFLSVFLLVCLLLGKKKIGLLAKPHNRSFSNFHRLMDRLCDGRTLKFLKILSINKVDIGQSAISAKFSNCQISSD